MTNQPSPPRIWQSILLLVMVRLVAWTLIPTNNYSVDMNSWMRVVAVLAAGENPYEKLAVLNWGPGWMITLSLLSHLSATTLVIPVRILLLIVDAGIAMQILRIGRRLSGSLSGSLGWPLFLGYLIHPLPLFLSVQHLNFDALFLLPLLVALESILLFDRSQKSEHLLIGAACIGLATFFKTPALVAVPLLIIRALPHRALLALSLWLVIAPVAAGLSVLYVLAPAQVTQNVLLYKSMTPFRFGIVSYSPCE